MHVSVIIPALNEAETVGEVVQAMRRSQYVDEVIVIDNGSQDATAEVASRAGAIIVTEGRRGQGAAMKAGLRVAKNRWIVKVDADLKLVSPQWISLLLSKVSTNVGLVKGNWHEIGYNLPLTNFLVRPSLLKMFPYLRHVEMPISGIYLFDRACVIADELVDDFGVDLDILLRCAHAGKDVEQIAIGEIINRDRGIQHDRDMAFQIISFLVDRHTIQRDDRLLILMAHSDDPVIWCGGTLAQYLERRAEVQIVLNFGTPERDREARTICEVYPAIDITCLGQEEFDSLLNLRNRSELAARIRDFDPRFIITHHAHDQHADHRAVNQLLQAVLMEHDPNPSLRRVLMSNSYYQELGHAAAFLPDIYIDISRHTKTKYDLISHHHSQNPRYWISMARMLDELNGAKSGVAAAESFETLSYCGVPAAQPAFR